MGDMQKYPFRIINNKKTDNNCIRNIVISLVIGLCLTGVSYLFIDFTMVPYSEEAGLLRRGFPHPMVKSGPFYAGYLGTLAREGGREYLMNATGAFWNPQPYIPGIFANIAFYILLVSSSFFLHSKRTIFSGFVSEWHSKYGILKASARLLLFAAIFLLTILLVRYTYAIFTNGILGIDIVY